LGRLNFKTYLAVPEKGTRHKVRSVVTARPNRKYSARKNGMRLHFFVLTQRIVFPIPLMLACFSKHFASAWLSFGSFCVHGIEEDVLNNPEDDL
jgi:hypothetical protein